MVEDVTIVKYDQIPLSIRTDTAFQTVDPYHSNYFWHYCAEQWHDDLVHKVYVLKKDDNEKILGYFSLRANEFKIKSDHIPIIDVAFIDVSSEITEESTKEIFRLFLEYIDKISFEVSNKIGCKLVRIYLPFRPDDKNVNNPGTPLFPYLKDLYLEMKYEEPPIKEKKKFRKITDKTSNEIVLFLKYFIRNLKIQN